MVANSCSSGHYNSVGCGRYEWRKRVSISRRWHQSSTGDVWWQRKMDDAAAVMAEGMREIIDQEILDGFPDSIS